MMSQANTPGTPEMCLPSETTGRMHLRMMPMLRQSPQHNVLAHKEDSRHLGRKIELSVVKNRCRTLCAKQVDSAPVAMSNPSEGRNCFDRFHS